LSCSTSNCTPGNIGPVCAICDDQFFRAATGECIPCEQATTKAVENVAPPLAFILLVLVVLVMKRKKIKEMRRKYGSVWRDIMRILTINISYTQVNSSMTMIIPIKWPKAYLDFMESMKWANVDIMSLFSIGCVNGFDYRMRVLFACMVPILIVVFIGLAYLCRRKANAKDPGTRTTAIMYLFDLIDADKSESIDVEEFQQLLEQTGQVKSTKKKALELMKTLGGQQEAVLGGSILTLKREDLLLAATENRVSKVLGVEWVSQTESSRAASHYSATLLLVLFMLHAPVSQRLFHYFACDTVGTGSNQKQFLRLDYSLECGAGLHAEFAPFIFAFLILFTGFFPLSILIALCVKRKKLYAPNVQRRFGFLYSRFRQGAEFWELHEVGRKLILMGILIFLPPTTRAASAIFVCVISCCLLNFFQPHRNREVLFIAQLAFVLSTFKYVIAILLGPGTVLLEEDVKFMGWLMILMDAVFMFGSLFATVIIIHLLRTKMIQVREQNKRVKEKGEDRDQEKSVDGRSSSTKVVPAHQQQGEGDDTGSAVSVKIANDIRDWNTNAENKEK